uniref:T. congolense-specific, cell surface-expressed gene family n=1 Tax=Trypanosoma congolense (strain IL3000) TaxID=1068625 RepID=G0UZB3_TRYCI|nr:hypothetical protein, unlikely [Trypanosoma congolense IL3000]
MCLHLTRICYYLWLLVLVREMRNCYKNGHVRAGEVGDSRGCGLGGWSPLFGFKRYLLLYIQQAKYIIICCSFVNIGLFFLFTTTPNPHWDNNAPSRTHTRFQLR